MAITKKNTPENWLEMIRYAFEERIHNTALMASARVCDNEPKYNDNDLDKFYVLFDKLAEAQISFAALKEIKTPANKFLMSDSQRSALTNHLDTAPALAPGSEDIALKKLEDPILEAMKQVIPGATEILAEIKKEMRLNLFIDQNEIGRTSA